MAILSAYPIAKVQAYMCRIPILSRVLLETISPILIQIPANRLKIRYVVILPHAPLPHAVILTKQPAPLRLTLLTNVLPALILAATRHVITMEVIRAPVGILLVPFQGAVALLRFIPAAVAHAQNNHHIHAPLAPLIHLALHVTQLIRVLAELYLDQTV